MGRKKIDWGSFLDVGDAESRAGRSLLQERFRLLQRQVPLLYCIVLANLSGLHIATSGRLLSIVHPTTAVGILVILRLIYWVKQRNLILPAPQIQAELRKTFYFAFIFSVSFCVWALLLFDKEVKGEQSYIIFFSSMAAVGSAYGLSSFPSAARLPLLFLGLPVAVQLILSENPGFFAVGVSLALVIFLVLRLLQDNSRVFDQLVESREAISAERERAEEAQRNAKAEKERAKRVADTDPLTDLANRRSLLRVLSRKAGSLDRNGGSLVLAIIDLDGFKPINDTFGHATGDAVLIEVGKRLRQVAGPQALVARIGGDEFALLLPGRHSREQASDMGAAVCAALQRPYRVGRRDFQISGCCGMTLLVPGDHNVSKALVRADTALYAAKENGRGGAEIYSQAMEAQQLRRSRIETALRIPENRQEIDLLYQPICDLATGQLRAFEALARWEHDELGVVSPAEFIPIAEQIGVISELSDLLLASAAVQANKWSDAVRLSFNVSAVQLCTLGSAESILSIVEKAGMPAHRLQVEVTETALLADFAVARENLRRLRARSVRIVLDDFGAGHASISYLREMQFDGIKIDGSLISCASQVARNMPLLRGVLDLCTALDLPCVAEHIETGAQLEMLRSFKCRDGQGFLLGRPMSADEAALAGCLLHFPLQHNQAA